MKNKSLWFLICLAFLVPSLVRAVTGASQDYDDQGMALYNQGLYSKSIEYFQNAVQADPSNWQAYEDMGNAYSKMNNSQAALGAYEKSLAINGTNTELQGIVQNMGGNPNPPAQTPAPPTNNQVQASAPDQDETVVVQNGPRHRWRQEEPAPVYKDNWAPMDHAKFWLDVDLGYNWSNQADFFNGANSVNSLIQQNAAANGYSGIATADHGGFEGGVELGFLLNPYNGLALGIRGIQTNNYLSSIQYGAGSNSNFETVSITPYVVPLTLDYYLFLPDHDGRFYLTAGVGYYFVDVYGNDNFNYSNTGGTPDAYLGDMYGGNVGFQVGIGREFEVSRHFGLRLFARGRYAKITDINGNFTDANGNYDNYGLVVLPAAYGGGIGVDSTSHIGAAGEHYATLDYTGFDVGIGLTFF